MGATHQTASRPKRWCKNCRNHTHDTSYCRKTVLLDAARSEVMLLQTYAVQPPNEVNNSQCALSDEVDEIAVQILNKFHPVINTTHVPISIISNGNCLFRAVSKALYGSDEYHTYIRLLAVLETIGYLANCDYEHDAYVDPFI
ncbi:hypothetical protein ElyMa_005598800 [Elysia marginata]|uniref:OTU domain-containing protein n=1 Tax=Elysia marginata TaxID=1093978 RepID=A0AAV4F457_9GAST|nr:hypothetical protein ElyMa_005598800 [Elysia marginata]